MALALISGSPRFHRLTPLSYLQDHARPPWHPLFSKGGIYTGYCPIHMEYTPSFCIYPPNPGKGDFDWHYHCYGGGCREHGDVVRLIWLLECGGNSSKAAWAEAYKRARSLDGSSLGEEEYTGRGEPGVRARTPFASTEQRQFMTLLMQWWYLCLWSNTGKEARQYLKERGANLDWLHTRLEIGYAPPAEDGRSFLRMQKFLSQHWPEKEAGRTWADYGVSTGLLRRDRSLRMQHRITFSCVREGLGENVWYYQGRQMPGSGQKTKYLGTPGLRKVLFTLPPVEPLQVQGTLVVESPMGPTVLAPHGLQVQATMGAWTPEAEQLLALDTPVFLGQDNDQKINTVTGEVTSAGEEQAEALKKALLALGREECDIRRVRPPREQEDPDNWVKECGVEPLLEAMRKEQ